MLKVASRFLWNQGDCFLFFLARDFLLSFVFKSLTTGCLIHKGNQ